MFKHAVGAVVTRAHCTETVDFVSRFRLSRAAENSLPRGNWTDEPTVTNVFHANAYPNVTYLTGDANGRSHLWVTEDGGCAIEINRFSRIFAYNIGNRHTFALRETPRDVLWLEPHPNLPRVALAYAYTDVERESYLTIDLGLTWVKIGSILFHFNFSTFFQMFCSDRARR